MKKRSVWLALLVALTVASAATAHTPPRNLHLVGDHWTAWNPPTTFPEGAEIYTIVRGDTLWDLAARFYGNPYLWPQLWERNRYIEDAHWIYPGDPLVVGVEVKRVEELAATEVPVDRRAAPGASDRLRLGRQVGAPVPLGSEYDIYCSGYVGAEDEVFPHAIVGSEYGSLSPSLGTAGDSDLTVGYGSAGAVKIGLSTGDVVYLDGGRAAGLTPGELFVAVQPGEIVRHPLHGGRLGRSYTYLGRVRVLSVQDDGAIAEIVQSCLPITVGATLKRFEPQPVPLGRRTAMRPVNLPPPAESLVDAATIILSENRLVSLGEDHVVYIDRGEVHDVTPGDLFTVYRMSREGHPPLVVAEVAVLAVHAETAVAKILQSRYPVYIGDRLEPK